MTHIYLLISPNVFIRFTIIFQTYLHICHADLFECQKVQYNKYYMYISIEPLSYELYSNLRLILDHKILLNIFLLFFNEELLNDNSRVG